MEGPIIVEVLDGRGRVHSRARLSEFPASIGRGYSSNVIIDDAYVDAEHLRLVSDQGKLVVEDAGTVNGTFESGSRVRATRVAVRPGLELRIGGTHLRFQDPAQPLAPALPIRTEGFIARLSDPRVSIPTALVVMIYFGFSGWMGSYERDTMSKQLMAGVYIFLFLALWAGAWALGSRVVLQRFNFIGHLTLASLMLLAFEVVNTVATWLGVMLPGTSLDSAVGIFCTIPLVATLLSGHLALASAMSARDRHRTTAGVIASFLLIAALATWSNRDDFSTELKYDSNIRPVPLSMMRMKPANTFFQDVTDLREDVDELATKANRNQRTR